eukprot:TRINITY_DN31176_c0_g1_i2.p2 TRINITY_DN31176_c0_g1~~TRINITY_DN31176_c0_g1_i2.p2  ORF type:complete len:197 (-),score=28.72 TRINITY_DN31176_c0_g1_i2:41-631(-)
MAFALELGDLTREAVSKADATRETILANWRKTEEYLLARVQKECRRRAAEQFDNATVLLCDCEQGFSTEWKQPVKYGLNKSQTLGCKVDFIKKNLSKTLKDMGLSVEVKEASLRGMYTVNAVVKWQVPKEEDGPALKKAKTDSGNMNIECGVCARTRPASMLTPCGHMLCSSCAGQQTLCPFCRQAVREPFVAFRP